MAKKIERKKISKKSTAPSGGSFESGIMPVGDMEDNLVMLVYGPSGKGKTYFSSTFPKPILVIDVNERGTDTIKGIEGIDVRRVTDWDELESGFWYLKDGTKYKTVVIDQITNLQDLGMAEIRKRSNKSSAELFTKKNWGELSGLLKTQLDNFRGLADQYNVCLIAHERIFGGGDEEDDALEPSVGARVMPSVGGFLDGAVDAIGNCFVRERFIGKGKARTRKVDYCMRIGPHAYYMTKIRRPPSAGPLPDIISDPSYTKIMSLVAGKDLPVKKKKTTKKIRRKQ